MKKRIALIFSLVCFMTLFALSASAATGNCNVYYGSNIGRNGYYDWYYWSQPGYSYLTKSSDGNYMKVQYGCYESDRDQMNKVVIEYYDAKFNFKRSKTVTPVLPIFGAFYETKDNYYIISGQSNPKEKADVDCFNIAKYDKNWKLIKSVGLKDCNTTVPFRAGTVSVASSGDYMVIRTCHQMYKSSDGLNHQANVSIMVKMSTMEITDSLTSVGGIGYCSHSFNQLVCIDSNGKPVTVDHGDAYPRRLNLAVLPYDLKWGRISYDYEEVLGNGKTLEEIEENIYDTIFEEAENRADELEDLGKDIDFDKIYSEVYSELYNDLVKKNGGGVYFPENWRERDKEISMLDIPGETGDNYTGCTVGGFEISDTSYIVAGTCVDYNNYKSSDTQNVFISVINKSDAKTDSDNVTEPTVTLTKLTSYKEGSTSADTPHLVKINGNRFLVIWTRGKNVYYQEINGKGAKVGSVKNFNGELSDCEPVVFGSEIMWYTWENETVKFYSININNTSSYKVTTVESGKHNYAQSKVIKEATFESKGKVQKTCTLCGDKKTETVPVKTVGKPTKLKTKTTKTKSVSISWAKSANAKKYAIYLSTDGKKWKKVGSTKKTTYTVEKLSPGTTYRVKVKAFNGSYKSSYSSVLKIKTKSAAPKVTLKAGSKKAAVSFNKVKGATAYEIAYSTDKSFKKKVKTVTVKSSGNVRKTIKKLKKGKKYYFKVRSSYVFKNKTVYSSYSKVKSVKIK